MARDRLSEGETQTTSQNAGTGTTNASETENAEKSPEYSEGQTVYLEDNRPPYRIERIGQRIELKEILPGLPGDLRPATEYIDREDFERLYRDNPRNYENGAETIASPEPAPRSEKPETTEKPYRVGDEVYLDDGAKYRIERIMPDSVTVRALGLDSRFVIAFRDMYTDDFEKQLRGNIFNQEILNRTVKPRVSENAEATVSAQAREIPETPKQPYSPEKMLEGMKRRREENIVSALAQRKIPVEDARLNEAISRLERQIESERESERAAVSDETPSRETDDAPKGRRERAYPTVSLPQLKNWLTEKRDGADLAALEMEITLREKEIEYIDAGVGEERKRIRAEIMEMTGGYAPFLPTPQISPGHDAEGMPITRGRREAQTPETNQTTRENAAAVFLAAAMKSIESVFAD